MCSLSSLRSWLWKLGCSLLYFRPKNLSQLYLLEPLSRMGWGSPNWVTKMVEKSKTAQEWKKAVFLRTARRWTIPTLELAAAKMESEIQLWAAHPWGSSSIRTPAGSCWMFVCPDLLMFCYLLLAICSFTFVCYILMSIQSKPKI